MHQFASGRAIAIVLLLAASLTGYAWWERDARERAAIPPMPVVAAASAALPDFSAVISRYGAAVVNVTAITERASDPSEDVMPPLPRPPHPLHPLIPRKPGPEMGMGSGFIISSDGLILTNAHVVDGATEVDVKLTDKREFKAKVLGIDLPSDVALLRIKAEGLPSVACGDPGRTRVGEWVLTIGAPFGFENSASVGILSARSRSLPDEGYVTYLQTDAAVNPGNSGGPLFNLRGEVIGVNSQIFTRSGGFQGVSFAIPIDVALQVKDQILRSGKVVRGRMGVVMQNLDQALAHSFGLKRPEGALVNSIEAGGPADRGGLKPGDIILSLNGEAVESSTTLPPRVAAMKPGSEAVLGIWRNNAKWRLTVRVGELQQRSGMAAPARRTMDQLGLAVRPLSREERDQARSGNGLMVLQVSGAAARAGIAPGDVILAINGTPIRDAIQMRTLAIRSGQHVALLVQRDNARLFVPLDLG